MRRLLRCLWPFAGYLQADRIDRRAARANVQLSILLREIKLMSAKMQAVLAKAAALNTRLASMEAIMSGLAQAIRDSKGDEAALDQLAADIDGMSAAADAAILANTPAN